MNPRIYLAGPDVFLPNAKDQAGLKAGICKGFGIEPLHPLDNAFEGVFHDKRIHAEAIMRANVEMMRKADGCIANLTPYHGPSADVGTVFEVGFMHALGKPVFGYSNTEIRFDWRVDSYLERADNDSLAIRQARMSKEEFGLFDNLMLPFALTGMSTGETTLKERYTDLFAFQVAVHLTREHFEA